MLVGPLMYALSRRVRFLLHALDGFVLTAVGSLVLLHIAPRALALGGLWSVATGAIGLALPALFERMVFTKRAEAGARALPEQASQDQRVRGWAVVLGLLGLVSHTLIDGAAIGTEKQPGALSWAIVLHRLPAGILVWWLVRPAFGLKRASLMLAGLIAATIAGFLLGARFDFVEERWLAVFEMFVAGALLHVLLSHGPELHGETGPHNRVAEIVGAALGIAVVALSPEASGHEHTSFGATEHDLLRLTHAIALPLIAGLAIAGFLATSRFARARRGIAAAILRPVGAAKAARAFREDGDLVALAATPQLGPPAILLSLVLLGPLFTAVRFAGAIFASLAVAAVVRIPAADHHHHREDEPPFSIAAALRLGFIELMDESAAWILVGVSSSLLLADATLALPPLASVPIAAAIALFLFVSSTGATPLAGAAIGAGLSPGSALAFLIAGSMVHTTSLAAIQMRADRRAAARFALATFVVAATLGFAADALLPPLSLPSLSFALDGSVDRASSILLLTLLSAALVRLGPRGFVQTLLRPADDGAHEHRHHHA